MNHTPHSPAGEDAAARDGADRARGRSSDRAAGRSPAPGVRAAVIALAAAFFGLLLAWSWAGVAHQPSPRGLRVAVVAPAAVTGQLQAGLNTHAPGAFDLVSYPTQAQASDAVRSGGASGALVVTMPAGQAAGPKLELFTAAAGGPVTVEVLTDTFSQAAAAEHASFSTADLVPLPAADLLGATGFFITLATLLPSVVVGVLLGLVGFALSRPRLVATVAGYAVLLGGGAVWLAVGGLGAFAGHGPAVAGIEALMAFAVALTIASAIRHFSHIPLPFVALLLLAVGIPASGTPAGLTRFVPGFFSWIAPGVPNSAAVSAIRDAVYFGGHGVLGPVVGLGCWALAALALASLTPRRGTDGAAAAADALEPIPALG